ncbi:hypothetical protein C8T65DRAFT_749159 [Cerioporus squamosus]|nr:hypothetical protein C8T65DRAFT_749159 [Cerioporus squamosus]
MPTSPPLPQSMLSSSPTAPNKYLSIPKNRLLGVHATTDHTSETQFNGWQKKFHEVTTAFNNSPLSQRIGQTVDLEIFALKLRGVGGDHAADQLKTTRKMQDWKKEMTYLSLACNHLTSGPEPSHALQNLTLEVTASVIAAAGGLTAWEELSVEDRVGSFAAKLRTAMMNVGKDVYAELPAEEKRPLDLFVRLGCAMHKDLNAVKGGASVMGPAWIEMGATPPILLANKENASTLRDIDPDLLEVGLASAAVDELTPAELRALESSMRGGMKLTSLAGALFNHQDDKRGYHDTYVFYFQQIVGHPLRFPDTSNTRYQSHCAAAAELLTHLPHYIRFLELVRDKKTKPGFTNLEENVYRGLHDPATLTELAVLALYGQAVTHPYMRVVRQTQVNGLDLGPLPDQVKEYIKALIESPNVLIHPDPADIHTTAMDGQSWENPDAVAAIQKMAPDLPYLKPLLVRFLKGALETWERFTIEFAAGGVIDGLSAAERGSVWIMPTNDHNEGILGGDRVWTRQNPNGSEAVFNAEKKAEQNETEKFMEEYLNTEEDERNLRSTARKKEAQHHESERRRQLTEHMVNTAAQNAREAAEKEQKAADYREQLRQRELVFDRAALERMTVAAMEAQLEVYRETYKGEIPKTSHIRLREEKLAALVAAVELHLQRNPHLLTTHDTPNPP